MKGATVERIETDDPNGVALRKMGQAARAAADSYTLRTWAARLAAKAGPKDYRGQLRELYNGITARWRYVMEPGEWVPGSARAVTGQVLGAAYNQGPTCPSPTSCDVERTPWKARGWGDCDDVSALAAAGVLALGMTPYFRVARTDRAAHVSVTARTPTGELVELDPVGFPGRRFGWAATGPHIDVMHHSLDGERVELAAHNGASPMIVSSYLGSDLSRRTTSPHLAMVRADDVLGPRVIALPGTIARMFRSGAVVPGALGVDQYGTRWRYSGDLDVWIPTRSPAGVTCPSMMGATTLRQRRARRRRKTLRKVGRFFRQVGRAVGRVMKPLIKGAAKVGLATVGVPPGVTSRLLSGELDLASPKMRGAWRRLVREQPDRALQLVAAMHALRQPMALGCACEGRDDVELVRVMDPRHGSYTAAPVPMLLGVEGVYDPALAEIASEPTPGKWYRVRKGDTLLGIAGKAFGVGAGGTRLKRAQWIDAADANSFALVPTKPGTFDAKQFGPKIVGLLPKWSSDPAEQQQGVRGGSYPVLWIPPAEGVEPPRVVEPPPPPVPPVPPTPEPEPVEPEPVPIICPKGTKLVDGRCELDVPPPAPPPVPPPPEPPVVVEPDEPVEPVEPEPPAPGPFVPPTPKPCPPGFVRVAGQCMPTSTTPIPCAPWETRDPESGRCVPITPPVPPTPSNDCPPGYRFDPYSRSCVSVDPFPMPTPTPTPTPHPSPVYPPGPAPAQGDATLALLAAAAAYLMG